MMLAIYLCLSTVLFLLWGIVWSTKDVFNLIAKVVFIFVGLFGLVQTLLVFHIVMVK